MRDSSQRFYPPLPFTKNHIHKLEYGLRSWFYGHDRIYKEVASCPHPRTIFDFLDVERYGPPPSPACNDSDSGTVRKMDESSRNEVWLCSIVNRTLLPLWTLLPVNEGGYVPHNTWNRKALALDSLDACKAERVVLAWPSPLSIFFHILIISQYFVQSSTDLVPY